MNNNFDFFNVNLDEAGVSDSDINKHLKQDVFITGNSDMNGFGSPGIEDLLAYNQFVQSNTDERKSNNYPVLHDHGDIGREFDFSVLSGDTSVLSGYTHVNSAPNQSIVSTPKPQQKQKPKGVTSTRRKSKCCAHCGITSAPAWRRSIDGKESLCNACGLYSKIHGRRREMVCDQTGLARTKRNPKPPKMKSKEHPLNTIPEDLIVGENILNSLLNNLS